MAPMIRPLDLVILGASGRVGRLLCAGFAAVGPHIRLWTLPGRGKMTAAPWPRTGRPPDGLLCLTGVTPASGGGRRRMTQNTPLALAALDLARHLRVARVFLASTAAVYGRTTAPFPLCETHNRPTPTSQYGHAKRMMEQAAKRWQAARIGPMAVTCLRIGNVAGADRLLQNAARGEVRLDIFANGQSPLRSYIGPQTLAAVLASLLYANPASLPAILNIAAPQPVYMADLLKAAAIPWRARPAPVAAIPRLCLDIGRLQRFHRFTAADSTAAEMVQQMRACGGPA